MLRRYLGVCLYDLPVIMVPALQSSDSASGRFPWTWLHNRGEVLVRSKDSRGVKCDWKGGSDLYLPKVIPPCGRWLFRRAFHDFPIRLEDDCRCTANDAPEVSFIIGHRGLERLPLLIATLKSIASQSGRRIECVVVEQDLESKIKQFLPGWVRYVHAPLEDRETAFSRGRAFNVGAKTARSDLLIFHDGDILVPHDYAQEVYDRFRDGFEFINLKRFIFYLDQESSESIVDQNSLVNLTPSFDAIVQNLVGGASFAITRSAYFDIGGFDERFVGWGYEDIEFSDRAGTLKEYPFDFLPFIHLWHKSQEGKWTSAAPGYEIYKELSGIPINERISSLKKKNCGDNLNTGCDGEKAN